MLRLEEPRRGFRQLQQSHCIGLPPAWIVCSRKSPMVNDGPPSFARGSTWLPPPPPSGLFVTWMLSQCHIAGHQPITYRPLDSSGSSRYDDDWVQGSDRVFDTVLLDCPVFRLRMPSQSLPSHSADNDCGREDPVTGAHSKPLMDVEWLLFQMPLRDSRPSLCRTRTEKTSFCYCV